MVDVLIADPAIVTTLVRAWELFKSVSSKMSLIQPSKCSSRITALKYSTADSFNNFQALTNAVIYLDLQ